LGTAQGAINASAAKLPKDHSQSPEASGTERETGSALKGRKPHISRTFSAELTFAYFQTFHVWLLSFGGFAAKHPSFDTVSQAGGTGLRH
jgi:hypothetical protein